MDLNNMLCVGRSRLAKFRTERIPKFHSVASTDTPSLTEMNSASGLSENGLISGHSSRLTTGSHFSPTRSILRGRVPSPKQGSPSSLRNVRFSDNEECGEVLYAKIHVNKNIQTDNKSVSSKDTREHSTKHNPMKLHFGDDFKDSKQHDMHEVKTSTPRYSQFEDAPSLDFHTPRGRKETKNSIACHSAQNNQSNVTIKERPSTEHERIVIDIDIDRKRPNRDSSPHSRPMNGCGQRRGEVSTESRSAGNDIIRNMDLNLSNRSHSPERTKTNTPDGNRIIRNLELSENGMRSKSIASQTSSSEASSPRSTSPDIQFTEPMIPDGSGIIKNMELCHLHPKTHSVSVQTPEIPDGNRIIQNLEFGSRDTSREHMTDDSTQTQSVEIPDGKRIIQNLELHTANKNKSVEVQTSEQEPFRSVPVQTDGGDISDTSSSEDTASRSIGIQAPEPPEPKIPDGSQIVRNMNMHKTIKPNPYTESGHDNRSLNDGNWNEFVRHLELFNPSASSSLSTSVTDEETNREPISEPVLVYDRNAPSPQPAHPASTDTGHQSPIRLSERSARTFLESDAFTRQQLESVLKEDKFLSKLKPSTSQSNNTKAVIAKGFEKTDKSFGTKSNEKQYSAPRMFAEHKSSTHQMQKDTPYKPKLGYAFEANHMADIKPSEETVSHRSDKESLGFTPIETYSFNPETLIKTTSNKAFSSKKTSMVADGRSVLIPGRPSSLDSKNKWSAPSIKEHVPKNAFVQNLDLGPVPLSTSLQSHQSTLSRNSDIRCSVVYDQSQIGSFRKETSPRKPDITRSSKLLGSYTPTTNKNDTYSSYTTMPERTSVSGYARSSYSHVTGHSSNQPASNYPLSFKYDSLQCRPSSAPVSRSYDSPRSTPLTSSLKEMRSSAARKLAMGHTSDYKKDYLRSLPSYRSKPHIDSYSKPSDIQSYTRSGSRYSSRSLSPRRPSRSNYLCALNDKSNERPRSRERSRSISPMPSPRTAYDIRYSEIQMSTNRRNDTSSLRASSAERDFRFLKPTESFRESRGSFDSVVSRGTHNKSYLTTSRQNASDRRETDSERFVKERESRSLTRKPPLPSKAKTPRSLKASRSRSGSRDQMVDMTKKGKEMETQTHSESNTKPSNPRPVLKEKLSRQEASEITDKMRETSSNRLGAVTIGVVPDGLDDPECLFLGHDTIQKIINEAKL